MRALRLTWMHERERAGIPVDAGRVSLGRMSADLEAIRRDGAKGAILIWVDESRHFRINGFTDKDDIMLMLLDLLDWIRTDLLSNRT